MADNKQYRIWCVTEGIHVYSDWTDAVPTECPNNVGHSIDASKTSCTSVKPVATSEELTNLTDASNADTLHVHSRGAQTEVSSVVDHSTSSEAYISLDGMSITPVAGTYLVLFSAVAAATNSSAYAHVIVEANGNVAHSERRMKGYDDQPIFTQARVTVNGSQSINILFKKSLAGSAVIRERSMTIIKS